MRRRRLLFGLLLLPLLVTAPRAQAVSPELDGMASFGASLGYMKWIFDVDVADEARAKPIVQGVFRYRFSRNWILVGESGFGWNDYPEPEDAVAVVLPTTVGVLRRVGDPLGVALYGGVGAGIYYWDHKVKGKSFRDPWTENFQKGFEPGLFVTLEGERQVARQLTLTLTAQNHYMKSIHKDELPAAFGEDDDFLSVRLGLNFHWSPARGIIWGTPETPAGAPSE